MKPYSLLALSQQNAYLIVIDSPSINLSATSYNVTEGDDLNLECISDGHPPPIVTWSKVGGLGGITDPVAQRLTIRKANRTEAGIYTCTSANGIGKPATAAMKVTAFCKYFTS